MSSIDNAGLPQADLNFLQTNDAPAQEPAPPVKRGRGRPKGSKNKKTETTATGEVIERKKRPRTVKTPQDYDEDDEEGDEHIPTKKQRGPPTARANLTDDNEAPKKKRGRPAGKKSAKPKSANEGPILAGEAPEATTSAAAELA